MAQEYTLFETFLGKSDELSSIFVRLTSESDNQTFQYRVGGINIHGGLGTGSPLVTVDMIDATGDFVNHNRLDTDGLFRLYVGRSPEMSHVMRLKVSNVSFENGIGGKSEQHSFRIHFIHESWHKMLHETHNRGWSNVRISQVVEQIARECGFTAIDVYPTSQVFESIIQPNWTNLTMLKWLAERADPNRGDKGHSEFGISMDGHFFFGAVPDLVNRSMTQRDRLAEAMGNKTTIPVLKLGGEPLSSSQKKEALKKNDYIPVNFVNFGYTEDFTEKTIQGAGGVTGMYYDYDSGTFVRSEYTYSDSQNAQLSDWAMIHPNNEVAGLTMYHGRDTNTPVISNNRVSNAVMSGQRMRVQTSGTPYLAIGDVVEVLIPTPVDKSRVPYNETYSGFYMISEINHRLVVRGKKTQFITVATISRQGVDGKGRQGQVRSRKGRMDFRDATQ